MTIGEAVARIAEAAERAAETAKQNDPTSISGSYDSGRCDGLRQAGEILAQVEAAREGARW